MPRVLVVDDDPLMVQTLCDLLRHRGWEAHGVHSGEEALAATSDATWSMVLMDVCMPRMSGVDTLTAMRRRRPHLPVAMMTAYCDARLLDEASRAGAEWVLSKPFAPTRLFELLDDNLPH